MAIGTPVATAANSGTGTGTTMSVALPTIAGNGLGAVLVCVNSYSVTIPVAPAGWTQEGIVDAGTNCRAFLFTKPTTTADSGATFSVTIDPTTTNRRWAVVALHVPGAGSVDAAVTFSDTSEDAVLDVPAITPTVADALRLAIVGTNRAAATGATTAPAGWTEFADTETTHATPNWIGAWAGGVQLSGQAGVAQTATTGAYTGGGAKNSGWELTFAPTPAGTALAAIPPQVDVEPQETVTVTASPAPGNSAPSTYNWRQVSGPTVTLSGTGGTRTFEAPSALNGTTVVLGVSGTTSGVTGPEQLASVTILPQLSWVRMAGVAGGAWVGSKTVVTGIG